MIQKTKEIIALETLSDLLGRGRWIVFEDAEREVIIDFFDQLHYLPYLLSKEGDETLHFEGYIKEICERFNCIEIWTRYLKKCEAL